MTDPDPGRTDTLSLVTRAWSAALGVDGIAPEENFFDLGGDSMAATVISVRLGRDLGREVPVRAVFDHPTAAEFSAALSEDAL
ncbi:acyl carrier protein [Streptomyces sp. NBC_00096]|uniref:acyl carrier protein n=1 Tax=Streptomyces sp. NBC_00096 TaxID=2975650 RepID=UPI00324C1047